MPIIRRAVKGIGASIGLVSEAVAHSKARSKSSGQRQEGTKTASDDIKDDSHTDDSSSDSDIEDEKYLKGDEAEWALDEAAAELEAKHGPPPAYTYHDEASFTELNVAGDNTQRTTTLTNVKTVKHLPCPIIIPQRRPGSTGRGFIRAYAPSLESCARISQNEFLSFLDGLDKSAETSPVFTVINIAAFAVGFIPDPIAEAVSTAVQIANKTAEQLVSSRGRNTFLDKMNKELFMPKGLFCMIMAFEPSMTDQAILNGDISATDKALVRFASTDDSSALVKNLKSLRLNSGVTKGEMALPEAAPLVFPALDAAAAARPTDNSDTNIDATSTQSVQNKLKSSQEFIDTYLDRRARDTYAGTYPTSKLAKAMSGDSESSKPYASRFSDPNHPANSGTILGLLTGGNYDPLSSKRVRRAERRARKRGLPGLTEEEKRNVQLGRKDGVGYGAGATKRQMRKQQRSEKGGLITKPVRKTVGKALKPDVLYLTIVNLPSEAEMQETKQRLESSK